MIWSNDLQPVYSLNLVNEITLMEGSYKDGVKEGELQKAIQIAKNLKTIGMDIDTIHEMTGLPKEEIEKI